MSVMPSELRLPVAIGPLPLIQGATTPWRLKETNPPNAVIVNVAAPETPPPGAGLKTVTCAIPLVVMSLAGMDARNWVPLTNVVTRSVPLQRTTDDEMKFKPVTTRVKLVPPTSAAG